MSEVDRERLRRLLGWFRSGMLVTRTPGGALRARPMVVAKIEDNGDVLVATSLRFGKSSRDRGGASGRTHLPVRDGLRHRLRSGADRRRLRRLRRHVRRGDARLLSVRHRRLRALPRSGAPGQWRVLGRSRNEEDSHSLRGEEGILEWSDTLAVLGVRVGQRLVSLRRCLRLALLLGAACGEHVEAGLANAPSVERTSVPVRHHDVIANGDDSCPRAAGDNDPLPNRAPPCNEAFADAGGREVPQDAQVGVQR